MVISNNFSSIFVIGDDIFVKNFLLNLNNLKKTTVNIDNFVFNIYRYDGIDFINVKIDLFEIYEIAQAARVIKKYIDEKKYLLSNIIYLTSYLNERQNQILSFLSLSKIQINLVSLKPKITIDYYITTCEEQKLKTFILSDRNVVKEDFLRIIKNLYCNNYENNYEYIYELFIKNL